MCVCFVCICIVCMLPISICACMSLMQVAVVWLYAYCLKHHVINNLLFAAELGLWVCYVMYSVGLFSGCFVFMLHVSVSWSVLLMKNMKKIFACS